MKTFLMIALSFIMIASISCGLRTTEDIQQSKANVDAYKRELLEKKIEYFESSELTIENLIKYLQLSTKIKFTTTVDGNIIELNKISEEVVDVMLRQIILESGWLKSQLTREYNNLLGMKVPSRRPTLAKGKALGHASFEHWTDSVKDYLLWKEYWESKGHDVSDYYNFLSNIGYATATHYISTLKRINVNYEVDRINNWESLI